ncbi:MAG: hypothetical protein RR614_11755 [Eubacterium sp.]
MYTKEFIESLQNDMEIQKLNKQHFEKYGTYVGFHFDCFESVEQYKKYLKAKVEDDPDAKRYMRFISPFD